MFARHSGVRIAAWLWLLPVPLAVLAAACRPASLAAQEPVDDVAAEESTAGQGDDSQPAKQGRNWVAPRASINKKGLKAPAAEDDSEQGDAPLQSAGPLPRRQIAHVTQGPDTLPNDAGQVLRIYDIRPYTRRVTSTNRPEQAIVDWILRETGYEAWHSETVACLNASPDTLTVYHTPEVHAVVAEVVDRFVDSEAESNAFGLRVITVSSPNWRAKAQSVLHPVPVQTQGIQAWLMHKEDAAMLLDNLRKRSDFREHSSPHLLVNNGQSTIVSATRSRAYIRDMQRRPELWPAFQPDVGQFDEGFSLELNPLMSLDGRMIDAVVKCDINQLEKLLPVMLEVPSPAAPRQRARIDVPQMTHSGLHERFRWPADQVLLVGLGVVATPVPEKPSGLLGGLNVLGTPPRADLLVFIEGRGKVAGEAAPVPQTSAREAKKYHGRY
ncbi:MAG TPA: hypothetical protein VMV69_25250 [Pirellulales bacterium]|nr:hypothetical protein [Pirellulales bacterium]